MSERQSTVATTAAASSSEFERLADLERRSLLAEQARQLAHTIRTPLSVIDLVCETIQLELEDDDDKSARIGKVLSASAKVSAALGDSLRRTRLSTGVQRSIHPIEVASRLTLQRGGQVQSGSAHEQAECVIQADSDAFEAAVLHVLRLVGGGGSNISLMIEHHDSELLLIFYPPKPSGDELPEMDRADHQLMVLAAERVARDCGGRMERVADSVKLRLPVRVISSAAL